MRRLGHLLAILSLLTLPRMALAQTNVVDFYVHANTADANGTALTPTILANSENTAQSNTWSCTALTTAFTITSAGSAPVTSYGVRGTGNLYATGATTRRFAFDHTLASQTCTRALPTPTSVSTIASLSADLTLGPADAGVGGVLFDYMVIYDAAGHYAAAQLNNGAGGGGAGYSLNLETDDSGTQHSAYITVTPGSTYHVIMLANFTAGVSLGTIIVQNSTTGALVGSATRALNTGGDLHISSFRIGNNEVGTSAASTSYFNHIAADVLAGTQLDAIGPTSFWLPKWCGASAAGSSATMPTCAVPNVVAGDLGVVLMKWENTTTTVSSCTDGTTTWTASAAGVTNNGGANGEPHAATDYLLSSVATGSVTVTCTLGAAKTFRDVVVMYWTPPTSTTSVSVDGTATGNSATTGTTLTSGNITTATNAQTSVCAGTYSEFGATIQDTLINSAVRQAYKVASGTGNSAMWGTVYSTGFTGGASGTLSTSNRWTSQIACFKANAATPSTGNRVILLGVGR